MALLKLLKKDKIAAMLAPDGWYPLTITGITTSASKSGKSNSTYVEFSVAEGEWKDKEFTVAFNDGMNNPSILNGMQYLPFGRIQDLYKAIFEEEPDSDDEGNSVLDTDEFLGRMVDGKVHIESVDNVPANGVNAFAPLGMGSQSKSVF